MSRIFFIFYFAVFDFFFCTWTCTGGSRHNPPLKIIFRGCVTHPKNSILALKIRRRLRSLPLKIEFYPSLQMIFVVVVYDFKLIHKNYWCIHYYRTSTLSWLGNPFCSGFPTGNARPRQKGVPFCPGSGNRDKKSTLLSLLVGAANATCLAHPFVLVGVTNRDKRSIFFSCFSFLNSFSISIILLYFN